MAEDTEAEAEETSGRAREIVEEIVETAVDIAEEKDLLKKKDLKIPEKPKLP